MEYGICQTINIIFKDFSYKGKTYKPFFFQIDKSFDFFFVTTINRLILSIRIEIITFSCEIFFYLNNLLNVWFYLLNNILTINFYLTQIIFRKNLEKFICTTFYFEVTLLPFFRKLYFFVNKMTKLSNSWNL